MYTITNFRQIRGKPSGPRMMQSLMQPIETTTKICVKKKARKHVSAEAARKRTRAQMHTRANVGHPCWVVGKARYSALKRGRPPLLRNQCRWQISPLLIRWGDGCHTLKRQRAISQHSRCIKLMTSILRSNNPKHVIHKFKGHHFYLFLVVVQSCNTKLNKWRAQL